MTLRLRRAVAEDARRFWEVNGHPSVRAQSVATAAIAWEDHVGWFARRLSDPTSLLFVGEVDEEAVAVGRFEREGDRATISVAVVPDRQGQGFGAAMIALLTVELRRLYPGVRAVAFIRPTNVPSLRAFAKAGYRREGVAEVEGIVLERWENG